MKKIITIMLICILALFNSNLFAQKHPKKKKKVVKTHKVHKHNRKKAKVVKAHRFPRNKVVVVKRKRARTVKVLPAGHIKRVFKGRNYYYHGGYYYNHLRGVYTVIAPPVGIRIKVLPPAHRKIFIRGVPHYYYMGVYYKKTGDEYETVEPTTGAIVPELPEDNVEKVTIDGNTYYEHNNMLYESIATENGVQYKVVGKLDD